MRYLLGLFLVVSMPVFGVCAGETDIVHTPLTIFGPSGLLFTQSANTLDPGRIGAAVSFIHERNQGPDITAKNELAATITLGLKEGLELSAQIPFLLDQEVVVNSDDKNNLEDINISAKWRFLEQNTEYNLPAFGLSLTYYLPTAKEAFQVVESWGIKLLLVSSAYVDIAQPLGSYIVGFYADGGFFLADINGSREEKHGILDLGVNFPLDPSRELNLIIEGNLTIQNDIPLERDFLAFTAGLRYIATSFDLTAGLQHRFKLDDGTDDTNSLILQAGLFF